MSVGPDEGASIRHWLADAKRDFDAGDLAAASARCRAALGLDHDNADALHLLGAVASRQRRHGEAADLLARAARIARNNPTIFNTYGVALHTLGRYREAARAFRRALSLRPAFAAAHSNLGAAHKALGEMADAITCYRRAIALDPGAAYGHANLGALLAERNQIEDAIACFHRAIELNAHCADAHFNFGNAVRTLGRYAEAISHYTRAIESLPGFASAHANRAYLNLLRGEFGQGWLDYEWRVEAQFGVGYPADPRNRDAALPKPSTLLPFDPRGKRLLVMQDQGLGDEIFFLRFAGILRTQGAWLACAPHPRLAGILSRTNAFDAVATGGDLPSRIDHIFLAGDLPLVAGCAKRDRLPGPLALRALDRRVEQVKARLDAVGPGPWLGLTWRAGNPSPVAGRLKLLKEVPLTELGAAASAWPGNIAVLQRAPRPGEIEQLGALLGRPPLDLSALNEDLEDMLALLLLLDEYAGVSNTNMHLRAGLNKTARVLIPEPPEWRWMDQGDESPWFAGFRLYRYEAGWGRALTALAADLRSSAATS